MGTQFLLPFLRWLHPWARFLQMAAATAQDSFAQHPHCVASPATHTPVSHRPGWLSLGDVDYVFVAEPTMWPGDGNELTCLRRPWEGGGFLKETGGAEVRVREMDGRQGWIKELRSETRAVHPCVRARPAFEALEQGAVGGLIPDGGEERGICDCGLGWVQMVAEDHGEHQGCWGGEACHFLPEATAPQLLLSVRACH